MNWWLPVLVFSVSFAVAPTAASSQEPGLAQIGCLVRPADAMFLDRDSTAIEYFGSSRLASQTLLCFPRTTELDIHNVTNFDFTVLNALRSLRCVRIRNIPEIPRELFRALSHLRLSVLHISGTVLSSRDFSLLTVADSIREFRIADSTIDKECLSCIGRLRSIESVTIDSVSSPQAIQLDALAPCTKLSTLVLHGNSCLTDLSLAQLARVNTLRSLSISAQHVTDLGLLYISRLANLVSLECRAPGFTADGFKLLARLGGLTTLSISSDALDESVLDALRALDLRELGLSTPQRVRLSIVSDICTYYPKLEILRFRCGNQGSLLWDSINHCRYLRRLSIAGCTLSEAALRSISSLANLEQLNLSHCRTDSQSLCLLKHLSHLNSLCLNNIDSVDSAAIEAIAGLPTLRTVQVGGCKGLRPCDIRVLGQLPRLSVLGLGALDLTPEDLGYLAQCPLTSLEMRPRALPDAAVNVLLSMPSLSYLSFGDCDIAKANIWKLAMKRTVRTLIVTQRQIGWPCPEYRKVREWRPELNLIVSTF